MLNTELIKLGNNKFYWFAMTFYILLVVLVFYVGFVDQGYATFSLGLRNIFNTALMLNLVLFISFVTGMTGGQEFQYNSFKYELISGKTRNSKAVAGFFNLFLQVFFMTFLFFMLAVVYYTIVNRTIPIVDESASIILTKFFFFFLLYSLFVYLVTLLTRHGIATIFITVVYFILEFITVQKNLLKLEEPEKLYPYLFGRSLINLINNDWQSNYWFAGIGVPLIYASVFAILAFVRIKRMQFK